MTSDPALNQALEGIFAKLTQKRAGSVPPLPTQLHHHHHHPHSPANAYAKMPRGAAAAPAASGASGARRLERPRRKQQQKGHNDDDRVRAASTDTPESVRGTGRASAPVETPHRWPSNQHPSSRTLAAAPSSSSTLTMTRRCRSHALKPLRGPRLPPGIVDPTAMIHTPGCYLYREKWSELQRAAQRRILEQERHAREQIRLEEAETFVAARNTFIDTVLATRRREASDARSIDVVTVGDVVMQQATAALLGVDRRHRRAIRAEWEAGFDEIAAVHKLALRHFRQLLAVRRVTELRQAQEERERAENEARRTAEQWAAYQLMSQNAVQDEEAAGRSHLGVTEASVFATIAASFLRVREQIRDHEVAVQVMLLNHSKRLQQLEAEKEKCVADEESGREKHVAQEKKMFDAIAAMEPEGRRRACNAALVRERREARERQNVCDQLDQRRGAIAQDEVEQRASLVELFSVEHARELREDARRNARRFRSEWLRAREVAEHEAMLEVENSLWKQLRGIFENNLDRGVQHEEKSSRLHLIEWRNEDRDRIRGNVRARLALEQAECRVRSEILKAAGVSFEEIVSEMQRTKEVFVLVWCEQLLRRMIEADTADAEMRLSEMHDVIGKTRESLSRNPRSRVDCEHGAPGLDYVVWLRTATLACFFGSSGSALLDGATLKNGRTRLPIISVEEMLLRVELVNPLPGDEIWCLGISSSHLNAEGMIVCETQFGGNVAELFDSLRLANTSTFRKSKLGPRVVKLTLDNALEIIMCVTVLPPLCVLPEVFISAGTVAPLKHFNVPPRSEFKGVRCIVQLPESALDSGSSLRFDIPPEYFVHPRNGILLNGKAMLRVNGQSDGRMDFEFDILPSVSVTKLLGCIMVVRGDDPSPMEPVELTAVLTCRDETQCVVKQLLDLDACTVEAPRMRVSSFDMTVRSVCFDAPDRLLRLIPENPQYIFTTACVTFPASQQDVTGGSLQLEIVGEAESRAAVGIRPHGDINVMCVKGQQLLCSNDGVDAVMATVVGHDTSLMIITFSVDVPVPSDVINSLLRSIVINSNRRMAPRREHLRPLTLRFALDACASAVCEPITADFKLSILQPVIEASNKSSFALPYREGSGEKCLPSMEIKQSTLRLGAEARLRVQLVSGVEETDVLGITGAELDETSGLYVFKHKSLPVAWWYPRDEAGLSKSELDLFVTGSLSIRDWMRERITDPYPSENFQPRFNSDASISGVNVLLRSITFELLTDAPKLLKKNLLVSFDDGRFGRSHVAFDLNVEAVDDPTEVILDTTEFTYRQNSLSSSRGFPLFAGVTFNDPDSDNFNGGYIVVEHMSGPGEIGDHLYLMDRAQQEVFLHQKHGTSSVSCLAFLLSIDDIGADSVCEFNSLDFLSLLVDEQPIRLLTISDNFLYFAGEQIGRLTTKAAVKDSSHYQLRMTFFNDNKFISFEAAQYALRCVAFENRSPKMRPGARVISIRLNCTGLKTTTETVEKVTITSHLAIMALPPFAPAVTFEDGGKPKQLLKQVSTAVSGTITHAGFFRAYFNGGVQDPADELTFENIGEMKAKDKSMYFGKELVGIANPRKRNGDEIYVNFGKATNQSLQAFLRSFCFSNKSREPLSGERLVHIDCSATGEEEMCTLVVPVNVTCRDVPTKLVPTGPGLIYMTNSPPIYLAQGMKVVDPDTKVFPPGSTLKVGMLARQRIGEYVTVQSNDTVSVHYDAGQVRFALSSSPSSTGADAAAETFIAEVTVLAKKVNGLVVFLAPFTIFFSQPVTAAHIEGVLYTLSYSNNLKADRGAKKTAELAFSMMGKLMDRVLITVDVAPTLVDFSHSPLVLQVPSGTPVPLLEGVRSQLLVEARFLEATVALVSGFDESDRLSFVLIDDHPNLSIEEDQVFIPSAVEKTKRVLFATLDRGVNAIRFRCESANNAAVQALLRSIYVEVTSATAKEVTVEVVVACIYGHTRELLRVRV